MNSIIKKILSILIISLLTISIKAQPYKLFIPNVDYLYADSANYFKGFRIIKTAADINSDSIYYSLPETYFIQQKPDCFIPIEFSWISSRIIKKSDGTTILFNFNKDSIFLKTQAALNETWICFKFSNKSKILANVSAIDTLSFFGISDSVKTISFELSDSSNNKQACNLDNKTIQISKKYGMLQTFNFVCFPFLVVKHDNNYSTSLGLFKIAGFNNNLGISNLSKNRVFDFQPGDQMDIYYFHEGAVYQNVSQLDTTRTKQTILERQDLSNTIKYKIHEQSEIIKSSWAGYKITHIDTIKWIEYNLYDSSFNAMPAYDLQDRYSPLLTYTINNRLDKLIYKDVWKYSPYGDTCYREREIDGCPFYDHYIEGLGGPYYSGICFDGIYQQLLVYYKKGTKTWGTPLSISPDNYRSNEPIINIYPNPWHSSAQINIHSTTDGSLFFFDHLGRKVYSTPFRCGDDAITLDRSNFIPGMYCMQLVPKKGTPVSRKFVVE